MIFQAEYRDEIKTETSGIQKGFLVRYRQVRKSEEGQAEPAAPQTNTEPAKPAAGTQKESAGQEPTPKS